MARAKKHPDLDPAIASKKDRLIHPKALEFLDAQDAKGEAQTAYNNARDELAAAMRKKNRDSYYADGVQIEGNTVFKLKGKRLPSPDAIDSEDASE